jgi:hypothetical protein
MRAEFFRPDDPEAVVGAAEWEAGGARIESDDPEIRTTLKRIFRPSPVALDDPALRDPASSGSAVVEPGDLEWFRIAAGVRGEREGLQVRFVSRSPGGWDPAGSYRPLESWVDVREGGEPSATTLGTSRA